MSRKRLAATFAAAATIAVLSACATTDADASVTRTATTHPAAIAHPAAITPRVTTHPVTTHPAVSTPATHATPADPALLWLASAGGQAQVTFNQEVDTLAGDLEIEAHAPTVANHLIFEADARTVRAQADKILATPALLPRVNRAAYQLMLHRFITVADLLQPGAGYGTASQDYAAWAAALDASDIAVS
jgi:hypothetical protein